MRRTNDGKKAFSDNAAIYILRGLVVVLLMAFLAPPGRASIMIHDGSLDVPHDLSVDTDTLFVDSAFHSIGMGTTRPAKGRRLHVKGSGAASTLVEIEQSRFEDISLVEMNNTAVASVKNGVGFEFRGMTSAQERAFFSFRTSLNVIDDASRNSLVEFKTNDKGRFVTSLAINGDDIGIGTVNPLAKLQVAGNVLATEYLTPSDARLKTSVVELDGVLEKLDAIRSVSFVWHETAAALGHDPNQRDIGVIAQELESVYPELVKTTSSGYKVVDYGKLSSVLLGAVKELKTQRDVQEKRLAAFTERLVALEQSQRQHRAGLQLPSVQPGGAALLGGLILFGLGWRKGR